MICRLRSFLHTILVALVGHVAASSMAHAAERLGTVAVLSDIHFDPFATPEIVPRLASSGRAEWATIFASAGPQGFSRHGEDTNHALLTSAVAALADKAAGAELVIVSGDLLAHGFQDLGARLLGTSPADGVVRALASETALYVAEGLRAAFPHRPVLIALGNNDSECGDYQLESGGAFLASLRETVRELAGRDFVGSDFDRTYAAAGYYSMRHPELAQTTILVLSDVLWSTEYRDVCGTTGLEAAQAMIDWFERQLVEARASGRKVWLVHHIPLGIDPYSTLNTPTELSCPAKVTPFLREPFASRFALLVREYATTIQAAFSGHTHQDGYRLVMDAGAAVGVEKIAPSISPIFGNNPGFHLFDYDRQTGDLVDFSTWYLADLARAPANDPSEWRREYVFTKAYDQPTYSAAAVERIAQALLGAGVAGEQVRATFRRYYPVGQGEISPGTLPAYACGIGNIDLSTFIACFCDK